MVKLPQLKTFEEIDFAGIVNDFEPPKKSEFKLPRIAFIGYFRHLSMGCQRRICKHIGFECYEETMPFDKIDQGQSTQITGKWSDITKDFTRLIVIGNEYELMAEWQFESLLYKKYKNSNHPIFVEHSIPVIMEDQLWKIHNDYPNISNSTLFRSDSMRKIRKDFLSIDDFALR